MHILRTADGAPQAEDIAAGLLVHECYDAEGLWCQVGARAAMGRLSFFVIIIVITIIVVSSSIMPPSDKMYSF